MRGNCHFMKYDLPHGKMHEIPKKKHAINKIPAVFHEKGIKK